MACLSKPKLSKFWELCSISKKFPFRVLEVFKCKNNRGNMILLIVYLRYRGYSCVGRLCFASESFVLIYKTDKHFIYTTELANVGDHSDWGGGFKFRGHSDFRISFWFNGSLSLVGYSDLGGHSGLGVIHMFQNFRRFCVVYGQLVNG